jgi:hypothetical protein
VNLVFPKDKPVTWTEGVDDGRALQKSKSAARVTSLWWGWTGFDIDVNLLDDRKHRVALYILDWDSNTRAETIEIQNGLSGSVIDTRQASKFTEGQYFVWELAGHVAIHITRVGGANAAASALFFD